MEEREVRREVNMRDTASAVLHTVSCSVHTLIPISSCFTTSKLLYKPPFLVKCRSNSLSAARRKPCTTHTEDNDDGQAP